MEDFQRIAELIRLFNELGISRFEGEYLLRSRSLETLEEMFGLV